MPGPDDLKIQTPGEPIGTITPLAGVVADATGGNSNASETDAAKEQPPVYAAKHNGGGRFIVVDADGDKVGDFTGTKAEAAIEANRLADGGEPLVLDPERKEDRAAQAQPKQSPASTVDATTLKQAVMTPDGWLCPEPPVKE